MGRIEVTRGVYQVGGSEISHGHVDHIGGAAFFRDKTGCRIVAHRGDREAIELGDPIRTGASWYGVTLPPLKVDQVLTGANEEIPVGQARGPALHREIPETERPLGDVKMILL